MAFRSQPVLFLLLLTALHSGRALSLGESCGEGHVVSELLALEVAKLPPEAKRAFATLLLDKTGIASPDAAAATPASSQRKRALFGISSGLGALLKPLFRGGAPHGSAPANTRWFRATLTVSDLEQLRVVRDEGWNRAFPDPGPAMSLTDNATEATTSGYCWQVGSIANHWSTNLPTGQSFSRPDSVHGSIIQGMTDSAGALPGGFVLIGRDDAYPADAVSGGGGTGGPPPAAVRASELTVLDGNHRSACTVRAPLHRCTATAPLHRCTAAPLHRCTAAPHPCSPLECLSSRMHMPRSRHRRVHYP
jgi:hypothetical protein